ncbi:MAG: response regulator [Opitutaceae bacterium]|nr:response regulator [Opitutaceae bacterium]
MTAQAPVRPILLADDNTEDLFFLRRKLAKIGVTNPIVSVEDGFEAIRVLKARNTIDGENLVPSILFLDIKMPGVTGFSVLSWVRSEDALNRVKVVMVSDSDEPSDIELATELGANAYLIKYPSSDSIAHVLAMLDPSIVMNGPKLAAPESSTQSPFGRGYAIPLGVGRPDPVAGLKVVSR